MFCVCVFSLLRGAVYIRTLWSRPLHRPAEAAMNPVPKMMGERGFVHPPKGCASLLSGPMEHHWSKLSSATNKPFPVHRTNAHIFMAQAQKNAQQQLAEALAGLRKEVALGGGAASSIIKGTGAKPVVVMVQPSRPSSASSLVHRGDKLRASASSPLTPNASPGSVRKPLIASTTSFDRLPLTSVARPPTPSRPPAVSVDPIGSSRPQSASPTSPLAASPRVGGLAKVRSRPASAARSVGFRGHGGAAQGEDELRPPSPGPPSPQPSQHEDSRQATGDVAATSTRAGEVVARVGAASPQFGESARDWRGRVWVPRTAPPARKVWAPNAADYRAAPTLRRTDAPAAERIAELRASEAFSAKRQTKRPYSATSAVRRQQQPWSTPSLVGSNPASPQRPFSAKR